MKIPLFKAVFAVSLFITANVGHAGLFGYSTTVEATDGTNYFSQRISSGTFPACELQRQNIVSGWIGSGYTITLNPTCTPVAMDRVIDLDKLRVFDWIDDFKWPRPWPVCLSCPYLIPDVIDRVYPETYDNVKQLIESYGVEQYNLEVQSVQKKYDLQGFENEMHNLELKMSLENLNR